MHSLERCGLKWSPDKMSLASGSNDNIVCIWEGNMIRSEPRMVFREHIELLKQLIFVLGIDKQLQLEEEVLIK